MFTECKHVLYFQNWRSRQIYNNMHGCHCYSAAILTNICINMSYYFEEETVVPNIPVSVNRPMCLPWWYLWNNRFLRCFPIQLCYQFNMDFHLYFAENTSNLMNNSMINETCQAHGNCSEIPIPQTVQNMVHPKTGIKV